MAPKLHTTLTPTTPRQIHITRQLRKKSSSRAPHRNMLRPMNRGISAFTMPVLFTRMKGRPLR